MRKNNLILLLSSIVISLYSQNEAQAACAIGSIIGGNGSCYSTDLPAGISPVGVVFDTTNRLAIALTDLVDENGAYFFQWSSETEYDTGIENCNKDANPNSCGVDGRKNTDIMLTATQGGTYKAAQAVNKYEPTGCTAAFCKKGKWFIPSVRDWRTIYKQRAKVWLGLSIMMPYGANAFYYNASQSADRSYWSSNEYVWNSGIYDHYEAYQFHIESGGVTSADKNEMQPVRAVVKY